jgi:hypothetical protein
MKNKKHAVRAQRTKRREIFTHRIERGCAGLPHPKEAENEEYHDEEADQVDDVVHWGILFMWSGLVWW